MSLSTIGQNSLSQSRILTPANVPSGSVIGISYFENATRTVYSTTPVDFFGTLTMTKNLGSSASYLLINALIMTKQLWSFANNIYVVVNGVTYNGRGGWIDTANSGTNSSGFTRGIPLGPLKIPGVAAGSVNIGVYWTNADGTAISALTLNPNSSDDTRYNQQVSSIQISEIAI